MNNSTIAYKKLEDLKQELVKVEDVLARAKDNTLRLQSIPLKILTEKNKADLTAAIGWQEKMEKRLEGVKLQIATLEIGINHTKMQAKSFVSKNGKPMRP